MTCKYDKIARKVQVLRDTHIMFGYPAITDEYVAELIEIGFDPKVIRIARLGGYIF